MSFVFVALMFASDPGQLNSAPPVIMLVGSKDAGPPVPDSPPVVGPRPKVRGTDSMKMRSLKPTEKVR